jgi:hypothetical protein
MLQFDLRVTVRNVPDNQLQPDNANTEFDYTKQEAEELEYDLIRILEERIMIGTKAGRIFDLTVATSEIVK